MGKREHLNEEELAFYVEALRLRRMEALPSDVLEHVQSCMECKKAIMEISSLVPDEVYSKGGGHPFFDRHSIVERLREDSATILRVAAGIVLVVATGTILYFTTFRNLATDTDRSHADATQFDTVPGKIKNRSGDDNSFLADARSFMPYPVLEGLASEKLRSATYRPLRPANGDTIGQNQTFSWEDKDSGSPCEFVILNNQGQETLRTTVRGTSYLLTQRLPEGLYYWKLEQAGELIFVRKFFVVGK
jgi:hypothetical protein